MDPTVKEAIHKVRDAFAGALEALPLEHRVPFCQMLIDRSAYTLAALGGSLKEVEVAVINGYKEGFAERSKVLAFDTQGGAQ